MSSPPLEEEEAADGICDELCLCTTWGGAEGLGIKLRLVEGQGGRKVVLRFGFISYQPTLI